ncbi:G protein-regulated inducer of neurite outgrowth 3 isoform X2 [Erinaceus europaeus]|uniref:G protein-regulated inducer of neurite outgrowth 3 isoform X2 n=1 Tax=Erinaceus europaeus TaxID=9365 RepID=A0ABM3X4Q5_ERIEU|nr:G protein-regulated inducer of neurite outgrowth 3 isoform X2 [Erinaceus europaeus]
MGEGELPHFTGRRSACCLVAASLSSGAASFQVMDFSARSLRPEAALQVDPPGAPALPTPETGTSSLQSVEATLPHKSMGTVPGPLPAAKPSLIAASATEEEPGEEHPPQCPHTHGLYSTPGVAGLGVGAVHSLMQSPGPESTLLHLSTAPGIFHEPETSTLHPLSTQLWGTSPGCSLGPCPVAGEGHSASAGTMPAHQHAHQAQQEDTQAPSPSTVSTAPLGAPQRTPDAELPNKLDSPADSTQDSHQEEVPCDCPFQEVSQGGALRVEAATRACAEEGDRQATLGSTLVTTCQSPVLEERCPGDTPPSTTTKDTITSETHSSSRVPSQSSESLLPREHQASGFKEASTMTPQPESVLVSKPYLQDAEVQAVASVQSRAVSTSPSMLAAFLKGTPMSGPAEPQEQLRILCGGSGVHTLELTDIASGPPDSLVCPQSLPSQTAFLGASPSVNVAVEALKVSSMTQVSPKDAEDSCKEGHTPAEMSSVGGQLTTAQLADANACSVEQVSVHAGSRTESSHPVETSKIRPSESPVKAMNGHKLAPDCNVPQACGHTHQAGQPGSSEPWDGGERKSLSPQGVTAQVCGGANSNLEAGDRAEVKSVLLSPVPPGSATSPGRKGQEGTEDNAQGKAASLGLGLGFSLTADASPGSGKRTPARSVKASPRRASRVSEFLKEQRLNVSAAAAQVGLTPGEKKKQSDPKLHLKQSKRVRDVVWDEQGMTWEVYGASLDPESLGVAIQNHLQRQIREHEKFIKAQSSQSRRSISSEASSNKKLKGRQHSVLQAMFQNFRRPNCCVRPAPSSVLD